MQRCTKTFEVSFDNTPNQPVVDACIAMDQHIAERDDASRIRNCSRDLRIKPLKLPKRFSDDFELALHCGTQVLICFVIGENLPCCKPGDAIRRLLCVFDLCLGWNRPCKR